MAQSLVKSIFQQTSVGIYLMTQIFSVGHSSRAWADDLPEAANAANYNQDAANDRIYNAPVVVSPQNQAASNQNATSNNQSTSSGTPPGSPESQEPLLLNYGVKFDKPLNIDVNGINISFASEISFASGMTLAMDPDGESSQGKDDKIIELKDDPELKKDKDAPVNMSRQQILIYSKRVYVAQGMEIDEAAQIVKDRFGGVVNDDNLEEVFRAIEPILEKEASRQTKQAQKSARKAMIDAELQARGWYGKRVMQHFPSPVKFAYESGSFQIVLGAIAVYHTYFGRFDGVDRGHINEAAKYPVAFETLWDATWDIFGQAAFYNFMVAAGNTTEWLTDPRLPLRERKMFVKLILPGLAMTAGSIVSHLSGELFNQFKACYLDVAKTGRRLQHLGMSGIAHQKEPGETDPCVEAQTTWTKRFHSYTPAIINMLMATLASGVLKYAVRLGLMTKKEIKTADGVKHALVIRPFFRKLRELKVKTYQSLKAGNHNWKIVVGRKGVVTLGYKMFGHLGNVAFFLIPDELMRETTVRFIGNNLRGGDLFGAQWTRNVVAGKNFAELGETLDDVLEKGVASSWDGDQTHTAEFIKEFTEAMEEWRKMNNEDVEMAHSGWMDKINGFNTVIRTSKDFYGRLIDDIRSYYHNVKAREHEDTMAPQPNSGFFYRQYPLYGVRPKAPAGVYKNDEAAVDDYLLNPTRIEHFQKIRVQEESKKFCDSLKTPNENLSDTDLKILNGICAGLLSNDLYKVGLSLMDVNRYTQNRENGTLAKKLKADFKFVNYLELLRTGRDMLYKFRQSLGDPHPLLYKLEGYAYAFDVYSTTRKHAQVFPDVPMGKFIREKTSDYAVWQMVCGADKPSESIWDESGFRTRFNMVRIVDIEKPKGLCVEGFIDRWLRMRTTPSSLLFRMPFKNPKSDKPYLGIGELIMDNMKPEFKAMTSPDHPESFKTWWEKNYQPLIESKFERLRDEYLPVQLKLIKNFNMPNYMTNTESWGRGYVPNALIDSIAQEIRVNTLILGEVLRSLIKNQPAVAQTLKTVGASGEADLKEIRSKAIPFPVLSDQQKAAYKNAAILAAQQYPWLLDFKAAKEGRRGHIYGFQREIERLISMQTEYLNSLESDEKAGKLVFKNTIDKNDEKDYEEAIQGIGTYLTALFGQFKVSESQKQILDLTSQNIVKGLNTYKLYVGITKAVLADHEMTKENVYNKPKERQLRGGGGG